MEVPYQRPGPLWANAPYNPAREIGQAAAPCPPNYSLWWLLAAAAGGGFLAYHLSAGKKKRR